MRTIVVAPPPADVPFGTSSHNKRYFDNNQVKLTCLLAKVNCLVGSFRQQEDVFVMR